MEIQASPLDFPFTPDLRVQARMQPFDEHPINSGGAGNSPSTMTRSIPFRANPSTPASLSSPVTASTQPALAHSCFSLLRVNVELFGEAGQPCANQKNHSTTLPTTELKKHRAFDHCPDMRDASIALPSAIIRWSQGIERIGLWTTPQISVPGTSRRIRFAKFQVREGRTLDTSKTLVVFIGTLGRGRGRQT